MASPQTADFASTSTDWPATAVMVDTATTDTASISAVAGAAGIAADADRAVLARELSIVVPTFNESANVAELTRRVSQALHGIAWELVFVDDDSPDHTAEAVHRLAEQDARVRVIQRIGRRGLSSACVEGVLASSAPFVAVMDADLQHDERLLPLMLQALRQGGLDIAIGSRYVDGGQIGEWDEQRATISRLATRVSHAIVPAALKDPMSGFFMIRREAFMDRVHSLSALGFKILVDLFASGTQPLRFVELPYAFRARHAGQSKLDSHVAWDYGMLLIDKLIGRWIPARFVSFGLIGSAGVIVHMAVLAALFKPGLVSFQLGQGLAAAVAMVFNFFVNNLLTYRDQRLRGARLLRGLASFMLVCSVGAVANVGVAQFLFSHEQGWVPAALIGIVVAAVWNFATSSFYTWGRRSG